MKKIYLKLFLCFFVLFHIKTYASTVISTINDVNWIEISEKRFAPQIMFDFSKPLYFEKKIDKDKMVLELSFPGMSLETFEKHDIVTKIKTLRKMISKVEICNRKVPSPRVVLTITFSKKDILIRWNKMEDPNRLILDIFSKKALKDLQKNGAIYLHAKNDVIKNDFSANRFQNLTSYKSNFFKNKDLIKKKIRILVDAGHGGQDSGAKGFFSLKEKDIALDIARRTKYLLNKNGFNAFLTRNCDKDLSLLERSELANQLKANFFISIHVNSLQGVEKLNGIETYYLNDEGLLSNNRFGGYLFVYNKDEMKLARMTDSILQNNINLSKSLASSIHNNVMNFFSEKINLSVNDRGIKTAHFRILLRSEIPVALIEVGFLTNKQEAKRLTNPVYRQILANGIYKGIEKYIYSQN